MKKYLGAGVLILSLVTYIKGNTQSLENMKYRGVVYDVGLQYNPGQLSVDSFTVERVKYDMTVIAKELHANSVRIEGETISRLVSATEAAHDAGLKVLFNPWKMNANAEETVEYMAEAAIEAEKLRKKGINLVFVTGCEYTIFSRGAFPGETFHERIAFMTQHGGEKMPGGEKIRPFEEASKKLNEILGKVTDRVRQNFKGLVTYASGPWENIDWTKFDIVGIDYYRTTESAEEYVSNLKKFRRTNKPLIVMEVGSCTYEGAGKLGPGGFTILQGVNPDGTIIFRDGKVPVRSEKEQADYVETQVNLLHEGGADGIFVFVFAFPVMPYVGEGDRDFDMVTFSLVKSFWKGDVRSQKMPNWEKKEAFDRLSKVYLEMQRSEVN